MDRDVLQVGGAVQYMLDLLLNGKTNRAKCDACEVYTLAALLCELSQLPIALFFCNAAFHSGADTAEDPNNVLLHAADCITMARATCLARGHLVIFD